MANNVKVINNTNKVLADLQRELKAAVLNKAEDIGFTAQMLAPKLTGALVSSREVNINSGISAEVSFNTAYATRRHYENKKNPGSLRYLERAGDIEFAKGLRLQ